jgi:hypothetical protein
MSSERPPGKPACTYCISPARSGKKMNSACRSGAGVMASGGPLGLAARPSDVDEMIRMRLEEKNWSKRAGKKRRSHGQESSAWVNSYGQEL